MEVLRNGVSVTMQVPSGPMPLLRPDTGPIEPVSGRSLNPADRPFPNLIRLAPTQRSLFTLHTIPAEKRAE